MKSWSVVVMSMVLALFLSEVALAVGDTQATDWRARISVAYRDAYSETDTDEEVGFGREVAARLLGQYKMSGSLTLQKYVNLVGATLIRNCNRPELDFHFVVVDSSEINAYSTPGGYVFVTSAVLKLMDNEAELAGVLAHEIAHVTGRHLVKELNLKGAEKSAVSSIAALIGGASESVGVAFSHAVDKAVDLILRDGYRKEDEILADVDAVRLSAFSGYDPSGLITFLDKIAKIKTGVGKTYPRYDERLATLQHAISAEGIADMQLALNTQRFVGTMKAENTHNPLDMIRNVIPGGNP
jgi:predicted Zn-dependent protease